MNGLMDGQIDGLMNGRIDGCSSSSYGFQPDSRGFVHDRSPEDVCRVNSTSSGVDEPVDGLMHGLMD